MKVYLIGAGPGDPELITIKGARLISICPVVLYTGSLVPRGVLANALPEAKVLDSSGLTLDEIIGVIEEARENDQDVARVHTGDPSIYGSTAEQVRRLEARGIEVETIPGVSSFLASAARLGKELTLPELSQTVIVTRCEGRTSMPEGEKLPDLARHKATMVLFLSITLMKKTVEELIPSYGENCPVSVVHKASMPDEKVIHGTLGTIAEKVREEKIRSQSIIIVGEVLTSTDFKDSRLYAADFGHKYRRVKKSGT